MSERKINLEEILEKHRQMFIKNSVKHPDYIMDAMKEACRQVLELASENAEVEFKNYFKATQEQILKGVEVYLNESDDRPDIYFVSKKSILDTINQIEP